MNQVDEPADEPADKSAGEGEDNQPAPGEAKPVPASAPQASGNPQVEACFPARYWVLKRYTGGACRHPGAAVAELVDAQR